MEPWEVKTLLWNQVEENFNVTKRPGDWGVCPCGKLYINGSWDLGRIGGEVVAHNPSLPHWLPLQHCCRLWFSLDCRSKVAPLQGWGHPLGSLATAMWCLPALFQTPLPTPRKAQQAAGSSPSRATPRRDRAEPRQLQRNETGVLINLW